MSKRIPIKAAREFVKKLGLRYVVIFGRSDDLSHVVTYGNTVEESTAAAELGNKMKRGLGWPEEFQAWPPRVKRRNRRLAEKIAGALFVEGGQKVKATRLVIEYANKDQGGGWCREVVINHVEAILNRGV